MVHLNFHPLNWLKSEEQYVADKIGGGFSYVKGVIQSDIDTIKRTPTQVINEVKYIDNKVKSSFQKAEDTVIGDIKWLGSGIASAEKKTEKVVETIYDDFKSAGVAIGHELSKDISRATYVGGASLPFIALAIPIGVVLAVKFL
jgi:phage-related protein